MAEPEVVEGSDGEPIIRVHESPRWQAEPPEADGLYVCSELKDPWPRFTPSIGRLSSSELGHRIATIGEWYGTPNAIAWWLVPALDLPPIPEETK